MQWEMKMVGTREMKPDQEYMHSPRVSPSRSWVRVFQNFDAFRKWGRCA